MATDQPSTFPRMLGHVLAPPAPDSAPEVAAMKGRLEEAARPGLRELADEIREVADLPLHPVVLLDLYTQVSGALKRALATARDERATERNDQRVVREVFPEAAGLDDLVQDPDRAAAALQAAYVRWGAHRPRRERAFYHFKNDVFWIGGGYISTMTAGQWRQRKRQVDRKALAAALKAAGVRDVRELSST